jgi:hypothetical protein
MPTICLRAAAWAVVLCCCISATANESADSFTIRLDLTDEAGQPLEDANVRLVGLYQYPQIFHATPGSVLLSHRSGGRYEATIDEPFRPLLHHTEAVLVVQASGRQPQVQQWPLGRLRCGVPIPYTLSDSSGQSIQVVDPDGEPLQGVVLSPAVWNRTVIPLYENAPTTQPATDAGLVTAEWIDSTNLTMVYAFGETIGNQRLPVSVADDGVLQITTMPTFEATGRWSSPINMDSYASFFETPVTVLVSGDTYSIFDQHKMPYCWSETAPRVDGSLAVTRLCGGEMIVQADLANSIPLVTHRDTQSLEVGDVIELKLTPAIRARGKVVDDRAGQPLSGLAIRQFTFSRIEQLTGDDGSYELWFHEEDPIQYYPTDTRGKYTTSNAFYLYPQELPVDGKLDLEPTRLSATSSAFGKVVDPQGNGVGGAKIECQYKNERFTQNVALFSDQDGAFDFRGVHEGSAATLTAMTDSMMTHEPVSLQLSPGAKIELSVHPRHAIKVRGRVVDSQGEPIQGAAVTIRTPRVDKQESYGGEDASAVPLLRSGAAIATDVEGHFVSPPIIDWDRRLSLEIRAGGQRTLQTYWTDAAPPGTANKDFDAGTLKMLPAAKTVTQRIEVVDAQTGKPLPQARGVCQGAYITQQRRTANDRGVVEFQIRDSTAVLAFAHQGYYPALKIRRVGQPLDRVELQSLDGPPPVRQGVQLDRPQRIALAAKLIQRVSKATQLETPHRFFIYYRSLAFADFDAVLTDAKMYASLPEGKENLAQVAAQIDWLDVEQMQKIVDFIDERQKLEWLLRRVDQTVLTDEKLDLLGEAIVLAQQQTGNTALVATGLLATKLFEVGEHDTAKQLLQEAYNDHEKLGMILQKGDRQQEIAIARLYLPAYAVVAPEAAIKLIELTATAAEVQRLQTMAIRYAVEYGGHDPEALCHENNISRLSSQGMTDHYVNVKHLSVERGMALANLCPNELGKADFLFELARTSDADRRQRVQLARTALEIMTADNEELAILTPSHWIAERVEQVSAWDETLAQEYLFEAFWSQSRISRITAFHQTAALAQPIAKIDATVARALIEPCFEDWSWLFGDRDSSVMFMEIPPLQAAVAIDPNWTEALIDDLFDHHLKEHPSRKLEVLYGVINSLAK